MRELTLEELEQTTGLRELTSEELELIAGGYDTRYNDGGDGWDVVGDGGDTDSGWDQGDYYGDTGDYGDSGGGDGDSGGTDFGVQIDKPCPSGAALEIASAIRSTSAGLNWNNTEYAGVVKANGTGGYGAYLNTIYSDGLENQTSFELPPVGATGVMGWVHNHPDSLGDATKDAISRYPSSADLQQLGNFVTDFANGNAAYNPSVWIVGSDGVTRQFQWSDRAAWGNLTDAQKASGVNLPPPTTSSCT